MKKIILFLIFLMSALAIAQTGERYEKYVGYQKGKYPLTLAGLSDAINSLPNDSGAVYIAYPGIDTTGLGAISADVTLMGWIDGVFSSAPDLVTGQKTFSAESGAYTGLIQNTADTILIRVTEHSGEPYNSSMLFLDSVEVYLAAFRQSQSPIPSLSISYLDLTPSTATILTNALLLNSNKTDIPSDTTLIGDGNGKLVIDTDSVGIRGNLDVDGTINGVKKYVALLTQTADAAPVPTVLENTLGGVVVWTRNTQGTYYGTLANAFTADKTFLFAGSQNASYLANGVVNDFVRISANVVILSTVTISIVEGNLSFTPTDSELDSTPIEIRVYP